jgi:hypothetical protein
MTRKVASKKTQRIVMSIIVMLFSCNVAFAQSTKDVARIRQAFEQEFSGYQYKFKSLEINVPHRFSGRFDKTSFEAHKIGWKNKTLYFYDAVNELPWYMVEYHRENYIDDNGVKFTDIFMKLPSTEIDAKGKMHIRTVNHTGVILVSIEIYFDGVRWHYVFSDPVGAFVIE